MARTLQHRFGGTERKFESYAYSDFPVLKVLGLGTGLADLSIVHMPLVISTYTVFSHGPSYLAIQPVGVVFLVPLSRDLLSPTPWHLSCKAIYSKGVSSLTGSTGPRDPAMDPILDMVSA